MPKPFEIIFWVRAALGAFSGILSGILGYVSSSSYSFLGLFVALAIYGMSFVILKSLVRDVPKTEASKIYTAGLGTFIMLFFFTWILYNTMLK